MSSGNSFGLWGSFSGLEKIRSPRSILLEQADALTKGMRGAVVGLVDDRTPGQVNANLSFDFDAVVPALNNYRVTLFTIWHPVLLYPLRLRCEAVYSSSVECADETEFEEKLKTILQSDEIRRIISRLAALTGKP